jgi:MFS family permease
MLSPAERREKIKAVVRVASGNFLEMYDFIIYGYYATYIARTFFPAGNEFVSLMAAFLAYGAGFLVRPIGAVVLGFTRTAWLPGRAALSLALMVVGTASIAITSAETIGILAPIIDSSAA